MFARERCYAAPRQKYLCAWFRVDPDPLIRRFSLTDETCRRWAYANTRRKRAYCAANETRTDHRSNPPISLNDVAVCVYSVTDFFFYRALSRASLSIRIAFRTRRGLCFLFFFFLLPDDHSVVSTNRQRKRERERKREGECVFAREASVCTAVSVPGTTCGFRAKHRVTESAYVRYNCPRGGGGEHPVHVGTR